MNVIKGINNKQNVTKHAIGIREAVPSFLGDDVHDSPFKKYDPIRGIPT